MNTYVKEAVKLGAVDAKVIEARTIATAGWVRMKCKFGCGGYGHRLMCPPYSPEPEETAKVFLPRITWRGPRGPLHRRAGATKDAF